mgnify:CR=1 FL=1
MMDVRHLAFEDIDKCLYRILRDSLVYLKAQDMPIDQTTEETYQYYNELIQNININSRYAMGDGVHDR